MTTADLAAFDRVLARTALRLRVQRGLDWSAWAACIGAGATALWQLWAYASTRTPPSMWQVALFAGGSAAAGFSASLLPVAEERAATAIDRAGGLVGRVRAAIEFRRLASAERSAFQAAALRDAGLHAREVAPARAAPYRRPRASGLALASLALSGALAALLHGAPRAVKAPAREAAGPAQQLIAADDLAAFRAAVAELRNAPELSPELRRELERYAELLAQIEGGTSGREQLLSQLLALEAQLAPRADEPGAEDQAALRALAAELAAGQPALAQALQAGDRMRAAQALKALARSLREQTLDARERERLARALDEARKREQERAAERERERQRGAEHEREREGLLKSPGGSDGTREQREKSLLAREQRALENLQRPAAREEPQRQLERLSRALARAGAALPGASEQAAEALEEGSEALERFAQDEQNAAHRRELSRELAQLRELLQRGGANVAADARDRYRDAAGSAGERNGAPRPGRGQSQPEPPSAGGDARDEREQRRERFRLRAQGADADAGSAETLRLLREAQAGASADAGTGRTGGSTPGTGGDPRELGIGEPGASGGELELSGASSPGTGEMLEAPGQGGGSEHDETRLPAPTRAQAGYEDRQLAGAAAAGPTRSQVIVGAAEGGFASAGYRKVYGDYRTHAEEWIERDEVPAGYRFYVRRYFQLVRPRAAASAREPHEERSRP